MRVPQARRAVFIKAMRGAAHGLFYIRLNYSRMKPLDLKEIL